MWAIYLFNPVHQNKYLDYTIPMPRKKKEMTYEDKRQNVILKLVSAALIISLALLTHLLSEKIRDSRVAQNSVQLEKTLGEQTKNKEDLVESVQEQIGEAKEKADTYSKAIGSSTEEYIDYQKESITDKAFQSIVNTTIKPILDKIEALPSDQQEYIRSQVCPAPADQSEPDQKSSSQE